MKECCKYLIPDKVLEYDTRTQIPHPRIAVKVYDKLIYKVCPNPLEKELSNTIEEQYNMGMFVSYHTVYVPKDFINDKKNCNDWRCHNEDL